MTNELSHSRLNQLCKLALIILIPLTVFSGWITNLLAFISPKMGTVVYDSFVILLAFLALWKVIAYWKDNRRNSVLYLLKQPFFWLYLACSVGVLVICVISFSSFYETLAGIRNHIMYPFLVLIAYILSQNVNKKKLFQYILVCMYIVCCFGLFQYIFHDFLPKSFLLVEGAVDFKIYGVTNYRVTGLAGDMLAFGGFSVICICLLVSYLCIYRKPAYYYLLLIIPYLANYFTYSRAGILGSLAAGAGLFLVFNQNKIWKRILYLALIGVVLFGLYNYTEIGNTFQDRFESEEVNEVSNTTHAAGIAETKASIWDHPWKGLGMGTQLASSRGGRIVLDGYWLECMLEMGIPVFLLFIAWYASMLLYAAITLFRSWKRNPLLTWISSAFLMAGLFFTAASVLNSALEARTNFCTMMILFGLLVQARRKETKAPAQTT